MALVTRSVTLLAAIVVTAAGWSPPASADVTTEPAAGTLVTLAGTGARTVSGDGGPATDAGLGYPTSVTRDADDNLYVVTDAHIRRIDAGTGVISAVAGSGAHVDWDDDDDDSPLGDGGPATEAALAGLGRVALDPSTGDLIVPDRSHERIRRIDALTGIISTIAGTGRRGRDVRENHPAIEARVDGVQSVAVDGQGVIYLPERDRIRAITRDGLIRTVAGGGPTRDLGDRTDARRANLRFPHWLTVAPDGSLYFADGSQRLPGGQHFFGLQVIRRVDLRAGTISTVAGNGQIRGQAREGQLARQAALPDITGLAFADDGALLVAEQSSDRVLRVSAAGRIGTVAGLPGPRRYDDVYAPAGVAAVTVDLHYIRGLTVLTDGTVVFAEQNLLRAVAPGRSAVPVPQPAVPTLTSLAGTGCRGFSGDGFFAAAAQFRYPKSIASAPDGTVYVADTVSSRVRRIGTDGVIATVVGTGMRRDTGDGPGVEVSLNLPRALAVDPQGRVLIADTDNSRIRRFDPTTGEVTTIAGTGRWGYTGDDGPATEAQLAGPQGVAVAADGTVLVADTRNGRLRAVDPDTGVITTLARSTGTPRAVALSLDQAEVFVADDTTGTVTAVRRGTGASREVLTGVRNPASVLDTAGGLLVTAAGENRVVRVRADGRVDTVAGTGDPGGPRFPYGPVEPVDVAPASDTALREPQGLTLGPDGVVWVADTGHHRVLRLELPTRVRAA